MKSWSEYFKRKVPLKLYVMHTGYVHMSGNIHYNKKDPRFKSKPKDTRFNPVFSYLVEHPEKGHLLLDTGLHPSFSERKRGNFGPLLGRIVKTKVEKGQDIASQLRAMGLSVSNIRNIVLSHLHLDHPGGLSLFREQTGVRVYIDRSELDAARSRFSLFKGYIKAHLAGFDFRPLDYPLSIQPFGAVSDFFNDGSVFVIRTAGHSPGHVSVLLNDSKGPILLTFDAAHRKSNLDEELPPIGDYPGVMESVRQLKALVIRFPHIRVIYGHDPEQLPTLRLAPRSYD